MKHALMLLLLSLLFMQSCLVPEAYMDEQLHVGQAKKWMIEGQLHWYDPMITTPPGIYIHSIIYLVPFRSAVRDIVLALRGTNVLSVMLMLQSVPSRWAWLMCTNPFVLFYSVLYYTDIPAISLLVLYYHHLKRGSSSIAFICGALSILLRQTSIIWTGFIALLVLNRRLGKNALLADYILYALHHGKKVLFMSLSMLMLFIAMLLGNKWTIVYGDQAMHTPRLHIPQLFYSLSCSFLLAFPSLSTQRLFKKYWKPYMAILLTPIILAIHYATHEHPYLHTDDRHLVGHFWKSFMSIVLIRYALSLPYLLAFFVCMAAMISRNGKVVAIGWLVATAMTVVPSPLIEPRYYLPSTIFLQLLGSKKGGRRQAQLKWNMVVAAALFTVFWGYHWKDHRGTNRYML